MSHSLNPINASLTGSKLVSKFLWPTLLIRTVVVFVHLGPLSTEILRYNAPAWSGMSAHVPRTWPRDHRP